MEGPGEWREETLTWFMRLFLKHYYDYHDCYDRCSYFPLQRFSRTEQFSLLHGQCSNLSNEIETIEISNTIKGALVLYCKRG